jgi:hypothetical protein
MADSEIRMVHAIPGRVRLKVPKLRHNPTLARLIQERLGAVPGIQGVEVTPLTGSVVVRFDPQIVTAPESLMNLSETLTDLFPGLDLTQWVDFVRQSLSGEAAGLSWPEVVVDYGAGLKACLARALGGLLDLRILIPLAFLYFGLPRLLKE